MLSQLNQITYYILDPPKLFLKMNKNGFRRISQAGAAGDHLFTNPQNLIFFRNLLNPERHFLGKKNPRR